MKKILLFCTAALLVACSASDDTSVQTEEVLLFVNHYKTTSVLHGTTLVIQENDAIGSDTFSGTPFIEDFNFEPGFTYTLSAEKVTIENAGTDASTIQYKLIEVVDKTRVAEQTTFDIPLARFVNGVGYVSFVLGNTNTGFILSREIEIDCRELCGQLGSVLPNEEIATGTFVHGADGSYALRELY